jgi:hypothetical protein
MPFCNAHSPDTCSVIRRAAGTARWVLMAKRPRHAMGSRVAVAPEDWGSVSASAVVGAKSATVASVRTGRPGRAVFLGSTSAGEATADPARDRAAHAPACSRSANPRIREIWCAADRPHCRAPCRRTFGIVATTAIALDEVEDDATRCPLDLIGGLGAVSPKLAIAGAGANQIQGDVMGSPTWSSWCFNLWKERVQPAASAAGLRPARPRRHPRFTRSSRCASGDATGPALPMGRAARTGRRCRSHEVITPPRLRTRVA